MNEEAIKIYAVEYSNYDPPETDSLWMKEVDANNRRDKLNEESRRELRRSDNWEVNVRWVNP